MVESIIQRCAGSSVADGFIDRKLNPDGVKNCVAASRLPSDAGCSQYVRGCLWASLTNATDHSIEAHVQSLVVIGREEVLNGFNTMIRRWRQWTS
ncbi:MAG: hypothetical protein HQM16_18270 [Deltaproteobacteria bacterium]|nr:hypothetical protein [Deltaproteobacteria bacterium]